ncbi:MAG: ATP-binding protein, partial [Microbacterium sp.]
AQRAERLLALPESQWFDRTPARIDPKKLAESIVAFANADGGTIVVGLSDGKLEGGDSDPKRLNDLMQAAVDFTDPTVPTQMHLYECVRGDGESDLLDTYATVLGVPDATRLLEAWELAVDDHLTVAGALLFAEHPERVLPSAQVRVSRFQGTRCESGSRQNLIGDDRREGPIPRLLDAARASIRRRQPTRRALAASGRLEDTGLVPEDAWLEGVVNAIAHRSYSIQGDDIHVDRIDIESPGRFPGLVDPAHPLAIKRFARNPRIARVCTDLSITQEFGEGVRRMFEEMRSAGLGDPPRIRERRGVSAGEGWAPL